MSEADEFFCVHPADRRATDPTPGKVREEAIAVDGLWSGFVRIPRSLVHREVNAGSTASREIITRSGRGPLTVNVDGPPRADG